MTSISEMKKVAKTQLDGKWLMTAGVLLVGTLILSAVTFTVVGSLLLIGVIEFGVCAFMLTLTRNKNSEFGKLLSGFDRFGDACLTGILKYVYTFLWGLLFVIPGYVKNYSYSMTMYIMQDHPELSGNEAITKSREMMNGHKFDLFVLDLTFLGWYILGAMTFGILLIFYVFPYHQATRANFYEQLRMDSEGLTAPGSREETAAPEVTVVDTDSALHDENK